jgi:hypothetical protein
MADTNFLLVYVICKGPWRCVQAVSSAGALEKKWALRSTVSIDACTISRICA